MQEVGVREARLPRKKDKVRKAKKNGSAVGVKHALCALERTGWACERAITRGVGPPHVMRVPRDSASTFMSRPQPPIIAVCRPGTCADG